MYESPSQLFFKTGMSPLFHGPLDGQYPCGSLCSGSAITVLTNLLWIAQIEIVHNVDKLAESFGEPRIKTTFLVDGGHGAAGVVVSRIKERGSRKCEQLRVHAAVQCFRVAFLKIGATAAANKQCISRERHVLKTHFN